MSLNVFGRGATVYSHTRLLKVEQLIFSGVVAPFVDSNSPPPKLDLDRFGFIHPPQKKIGT